MQASPSAMGIRAGGSWSGEIWTGGGDTLGDEFAGRIGFSIDCLEYLVDEGGSVYNSLRSAWASSWQILDIGEPDILSFRKSSRQSTAFDLRSDSGVSARIKAIT